MPEFVPLHGNIHVSEEDYKALEAEAAERRVSFSAVVREALAAYLQHPVRHPKHGGKRERKHVSEN